MMKHYGIDAQLTENYQSLHKLLACLYYIKNNKTFTLILNHGKTFCFSFYYYRRFLLGHHKYRNNKKNFLKGKTKRDVAPSVLSGKELYDVVL